MQVSTNALARVHTQQGTRHFNRLSLSPPSFSLATKTRTIESGNYKPDEGTLQMSQTHRLLFSFLSFFLNVNVSKALLSFDFYSKVHIF